MCGIDTTGRRASVGSVPEKLTDPAALPRRIGEHIFIGDVEHLPRQPRGEERIDRLHLGGERLGEHRLGRPAGGRLQSSFHRFAGGCASACAHVSPGAAAACAVVSPTRAVGAGCGVRVAKLRDSPGPDVAACVQPKLFRNRGG